MPSSITQPDALGHWGQYGGRFVPETLMAPLEELTAAYLASRDDESFQSELHALQHNYAGRPTPLFHATRLTDYCGGATIYLKREDLLHTGAHKINNTIGQVLLARRMNKQRIVAETGDGQRVVWPRLRRLYGRRRHASPGVECLSHATTRRGGS